MATFALRRSNWASEVLNPSRSLSLGSIASSQSFRVTYSSRSALNNIYARSVTNSSAPRQSQTTNSPSSPAAAKPSPSPTTTAPKPPTTSSPTNSQTPTENLSKTGFSDEPLSPDLESQQEGHVDWTKSYHGLSAEAFSKEAIDVLLAPVDEADVEIKPDGIVYLPEIKYRRVLNKAFGPGAWGLVPRGQSIVTAKAVTREYALVVHGRLVSIARGEQDYFSPDGIPTATEGCKSNALVRCCKDLGVASDLWDPRWIRKYKAKNAREAFVEHIVNKRKTKIWLRKDDPVQYPYKETSRSG
ncbi:hypothetical protein FQN54_002867 [Arachnomyces sp. PD_36]|nr:hypothetical protein FQN54_002867 [Arachnomyces sp. PD_36]